MLLFDRPNRPKHLFWFIVCLLASAAAFGWFLWEGWEAPQWPGGSSLPGLVFGAAGGFIIIFECLLWVRKKKRVWRVGKAQVWLRIHIWLGLLCLPILILHSGLRWGGWLSTILMVLLIIVVVSGVIGLFLQNWLPSRMLNEIPAETIYSQMDHLSDQLFQEGRKVVSVTCGIGSAGDDDDEVVPVSGGAVTVGAVQGKVLNANVPTTMVPDSEPLYVFFNEKVAPFLRQGTKANPNLGNARRAVVMFQDLRTQLPPGAHEAVGVLENFCDQRRQWDEQARLHFWLHSWLWIHFPLSIALLVLMGVHVFVAFKFW